MPEFFFHNRAIIFTRRGGPSVWGASYDLQGFPTELTSRVIPCCIIRIFEECRFDYANTTCQARMICYTLTAGQFSASDNWTTTSQEITWLHKETIGDMIYHGHQYQRKSYKKSCFQHSPFIWSLSNIKDSLQAPKTQN